MFQESRLQLNLDPFKGKNEKPHNCPPIAVVSPPGPKSAGKRSAGKACPRIESGAGSELVEGRSVPASNILHNNAGERRGGRITKTNVSCRSQFFLVLAQRVRFDQHFRRQAQAIRQASDHLQR